jgi:hypothetical protein
MALNNKIHIVETSKLADLTVGEFKILIREIVEEVVEQAIFELEQQLPDPDEGKNFRPEVAQQLRNYLDEKPEGQPAQGVLKELGLLDE